MKFRYAAAVLSAAVLSLFAYIPNAAPCDAGIYGPSCEASCTGPLDAGGARYLICTTALSFSDARNVCTHYATVGFAADLTSIMSSEQNAAIAGYMNGYFGGGNWWIGLYDSGDWGWTNGSPMIYSNWGSGEPGSDVCGYFASSDGKWYDSSCSTARTFICKNYCASGYYGADCSGVCSSTCVSNGTCMDDGSCVCSNHWTGTQCDVCPSGYWGTNCENECPGGHATPCGGNGTCDDGTTGDGTCECNSGYILANGTCIAREACNRPLFTDADCSSGCPRSSYCDNTYDSHNYLCSTNLSCVADGSNAYCTTTTPTQCETGKTCWCADGVPCGCYSEAKVDLTAFEANRAGDAVLLTWRTGSELECGAFSIMRCDLSAGKCANKKDYAALEDVFIPCKNSLTGAYYEAADKTAKKSAAYSYFLREIETTGGEYYYGPLAVEAGSDGFFNGRQPNFDFAAGRGITVKAEEQKTTSFGSQPYSGGCEASASAGFLALAALAALARRRR